MLTLLMLALSDPAAASSRAITSRDLVVVSAPREDMQRCGDPLMHARQGGAGAMTLDRCNAACPLSVRKQRQDHGW